MLWPKTPISAACILQWYTLVTPLSLTIRNGERISPETHHCPDPSGKQSTSCLKSCTSIRGTFFQQSEKMMKILMSISAISMPTQFTYGGKSEFYSHAVLAYSEPYVSSLLA